MPFSKSTTGLAISSTTVLGEEKCEEKAAAKWSFSECLVLHAFLATLAGGPPSTGEHNSIGRMKVNSSQHVHLFVPSNELPTARCAVDTLVVPSAPVLV